MTGQCIWRKQKETNYEADMVGNRENRNTPVDKELFLHYMDLWGVEIEGYHKEEG